MKSRLLLPHSLVNTIYYVNARFLSQLYKKENAFNGRDFNLHFTKQRNGVDAIIPRPNHGVSAFIACCCIHSPDHRLS